jgi:two-component system chemotaxis response regulator CheB
VEISSDPEVGVIETAFDAYEAERKLYNCKPDVISLDIEMPGLNGIEFLKRLMIKRPIPVIIVSSANQYAFEALNAGAVEFMEKPKLTLGGNIESFAKELISKIKIASKAKVAVEGTEMKKNYFDAKPKYTKDTIIAIGASTGGTDATYKILTSLPSDMPPIVIAQHMPSSFTKMYAERLNRFSKLEVIEAYDGAVASPGRVLVAPGDYHMRIIKSGGNYLVKCSKEDKFNGHRPSVDVLFDSIAEVCGKNAYGIILTGMGGDGAKGLLKMRNCGARTIGQDEATCVVYGMPRVAFDIGAVEKQVSIESVASTLLDFLK